jgi:hypothetical protein
MLETFRKHNYVLMCIIAAVVIVAFTFLYDPNQARGSGGQRATTLFGRDHSVGEVIAISEAVPIASAVVQGVEPTPGQDPRLARYMLAYSDPVMKYVNGMSSVVDKMAPQNRNEQDYDYPINVLVMRQEAERLGVDVDRKDLEAFVQTVPGFMTGGKFDSAKYEALLNTSALGDRRTVEKKLFTMLRDMMIYDKLGKLIGADFAPSPAQVALQYAQANQSTTVEVALLERKAFEAQTITDDEVKKYYEDEKAKPVEVDPKSIPESTDGKKPEPPPTVAPILLSEEKRSIKYVLVNKPTAPVAPTPPPPTVSADELAKLPEDQRKAKEEENKKAQDAHTAALAEFNAKTEEHKKASSELLKTVGAFSDALVAEDRGAKSFEELAKVAGFEVKAATFTQAAPPEDLKAEARLTNLVFQSSIKDGEMTEQTTNGWAVIALNSIEKKSILPMADVMEKVREQLKKEKIDAALKAAAESARAKLITAVKENKSFKETAAAEKLVATGPFTFSSKKPLAPEVPNGSVLSSTAPNVASGEVSEPTTVPEGLALIFVAKKELPKDPKMEEDKKNLAKQGGGSDDPGTNPLFKAWFASRRQAAEQMQ